MTDSYHVRLMTYYMNPHPALWAPLSHAWERGRGRGLDIVNVYTDMISQEFLNESGVGDKSIKFLIFNS